MPIARLSRFMFCRVRKTTDGDKTFLTDRVPYRYVDLADNIQHPVTQGDTLHAIAVQYYNAIPRAERLWTVIGDFQPDPIFDPTVQLETGRILFLPSLRFVQEVIFSERRRNFV